MSSRSACVMRLSLKKEWSRSNFVLEVCLSACSPDLACDQESCQHFRHRGREPMKCRRLQLAGRCGSRKSTELSANVTKGTFHVLTKTITFLWPMRVSAKCLRPMRTRSVRCGLPRHEISTWALPRTNLRTTTSFSQKMASTAFLCDSCDSVQHSPPVLECGERGVSGTTARRLEARRRSDPKASKRQRRRPKVSKARAVDS